MQIFQDVVLTDNGNIWTSKELIMPSGCYGNPVTVQPLEDVEGVPFYREVFTISQNWGNAYFHAMIENCLALRPTWNSSTKTQILKFMFTSVENEPWKC